MNIADTLTRPATLAEVACAADSLEAFGMLLRDWQHEVQRGGIRSRPELQRRLADRPPRCRGRFAGGDIADAYLAAYAEWLADRAGIKRLGWSQDRVLVADDPWFATPLRGRLLAVTPGSFRQRNLFTIPEPVFQPSSGRPRVSAEQKRDKARQRQKAYRARTRILLERGRQMEA